MDASRYSASETLRDGTRIEVRALTPADREQLADAVGRMSDESIHRRFFAPKRHFSEREIDFFLHIDFVNHVALVAVASIGNEQQIIGGGRYIMVQPGIAEVAFSVDDAHQGRGIGGVLMKHLSAIARGSGLRQLVAEVLSGNAAMLSVFRKAGLEMTIRREAGVVHVTLRLP
jgi:GNAT superfamily N-acetyltransferase